MMEGTIKEASEEEVKRALKQMKSGKVPGPTGMTSDLMKGAYIIGELTRVISEKVDEGEIPEEWKNSVNVQVIKKMEMSWSVKNIEELDYLNME